MSKWFQNILDMHQLTKIEKIKRYWNNSEQIAKNKKIGFIIRGNLTWESDKEDWVESSDGLRIKSNLFDPRGKHYNENPLRSYLQFYMNSYEIWGTLTILTLTQIMLRKPNQL